MDDATRRATAALKAAEYRRRNPDKIKALNKARNDRRGAERALAAAARQAAWAAEAPPSEWDCRACGRVLPFDEFAVDKRARWGRVRLCKGCKREQTASYLAADPARRARACEATKAWVKANPAAVANRQRRHRALKAAATVVPFTQSQLAQRLAYYGDRCWICGGPGEQVDHVKPLSKGGAHCLANLRPACFRCNNKKRATWPLSQEVLQSLRSP